MKYIYGKQSIICHLSDFSTICFLVLCMCPYRDFINKYYFMLIIFMWFVTTLLAYQKKFVETVILPKKSCLCLYAYVSFLVLLNFFGHSNFAVQSILMLIVLQISCIIEYNAKLKQKILIAFLIYGIAINLNSIIQLNINPMISRILANGDQGVTKEYAGYFMSGYKYIYASVFVAPVVLYSFRNFKTSKLLASIMAVWMVSALWLILASQYMTAIIFCTVLLALAMFKSTGNKIKVFLILVLAGIIAYIFYLNINYIFGLIINLVPGEVVKNKLAGILLTINGEGIDTTSFGTRIELASLSIKTFLEHPFIGIGNKMNNLYLFIGGHSTICDILAAYGIIGFSSYLITFISRAKDLINSSNRNYFMISLVISYFLLAMLNTTNFTELFIAIFIIAPALINPISVPISIRNK